jgi:hypothetical protein
MLMPNLGQVEIEFVTLCLMSEFLMSKSKCHSVKKIQCVKIPSVKFLETTDETDYSARKMGSFKSSLPNHPSCQL